VQISLHPVARAPPPLRDRLQQLRPPALLLGLLLACACACGGKATAGAHSASGSRAGAGAEQMLRATFAGHAPLHRARLALSLSLAPASAAASAVRAQSLSLRLSGSFEVARAGSPALFELSLLLRHGAERPLRLGLVESRARLGIELDGRRLEGSTAALRTLRRGFTEALAGSGLAQGAQAWVTRPRLEGSRRLDGALTAHLTGALDARGFEGTARRLLALVGGLAGLLGEPLPAQLLAAVPANAGGSVSLYSGARDHILRRLELVVPLAQRARGGGRYTLEVSLSLDEVNSPRALVR
jgi:hypothetical protein